jgi:SAM-dependent methyltransferase
MGLYRLIKRVVPYKWKVGFQPTKTLLINIPVRVWNRFRGGIPIPPGDFIYLVSGHRSASKFLRRGLTTSKIIHEMLKKNGVEIEHLDAVLDFGCGCGRIMRHWDLLKHPVLHGTDYNPRLVEWCKKNLKFAEFRINPLSANLSYESETFDFIYAFSVFTHLSEPLQFFWINELSRVLKPGGYIYFTTHGDYFFSMLKAEEQEKFLNGQLVVKGVEQSGSNTCAVYHPTTYVRENLARNFSVLDFIPGEAKGDILQDIYLLKKPT